MTRLFCFALVWLVGFFAGSSYGHFTAKGHVHTLSETQQVFLNPDCRSTDSCDLKRFTLTKVVNEIWFSDDPVHPTFSNGVIIEYATAAVAALEKYAVVQFKKGCVFYSSKSSRGNIQRKVSDTVASFGQSLAFCFPKWVIDSQDTDPAYNSDPEYGRFHFLRWNKPGSYELRTQKFYGVEKPRRPVVYLTDYPAGAFVTTSGVRNVALEFKTCIYKADQVPAETRRDDLFFARPIHCFDWQSLYVYDFGQGKFASRWADLPTWGEPELRADRPLFVILATLFLTLVLLTLSRCRKFFNQKARC
jgi:hypothetical protein